MDPRLVFFIVLFGVSCAVVTDTGLKCTQPHEVVDCLFSCPPQPSCRNLNLALPCAPPIPYVPCKPQCVCDDGYARNVDGICITNKQCEQCSRYTEYFTCNGPYSEDCAGSCLCNDGYARDANNTCVSTSPPPVIASPPTNFPKPPSSGPSTPIGSSNLTPEIAVPPGNEPTGVDNYSEDLLTLTRLSAPRTGSSKSKPIQNDLI